jgi:hypothetical protein
VARGTGSRAGWRVGWLRRGRPAHGTRPASGQAPRSSGVYPLMASSRLGDQLLSVLTSLAGISDGQVIIRSLSTRSLSFLIISMTYPKIHSPVPKICPVGRVQRSSKSRSSERRRPQVPALLSPLPQRVAGTTQAPYDPRQDLGEVPLERERRRLASIVAADVVGYALPRHQRELAMRPGTSRQVSSRS